MSATFEIIKEENKRPSIIFIFIPAARDRNRHAETNKQPSVTQYKARLLLFVSDPTSNVTCVNSVNPTSESSDSKILCPCSSKQAQMRYVWDHKYWVHMFLPFLSMKHFLTFQVNPFCLELQITHFYPNGSWLPSSCRFFPVAFLVPRVTSRTVFPMSIPLSIALFKLKFTSSISKQRFQCSLLAL